MSLVSVENLSSVRAQREVFARLSFCLEAGGLLHLTGANGSGKSSLLAIIAGLLQPSGGRFHIRAPFHFINHHDCLNAKMTLNDNFKFLSALFGLRQASYLEALQQWQLEHLTELSPHHLSSGQARAAALARLSLVARPLWLLDEPFASLDKKRSATLEVAIAAHLQHGGALVIAEHHKTFAGSDVIDMDAF